MQALPNELGGLRVLHVVPSFYPAHVHGGPIETVFQLCRHLVSAGCTVRVLTTDSNGAGAVLDVEKAHEIEVAPGLFVRYCPRRVMSSVSPALLAALPSYVRWADVIHLTAVYSFPTIPTLWTCKRGEKPLVWSPRGSLQRWGGTRRAGLKAVFEAICMAAAPRRVCLHTTSAEERRESLLRFPRLEAAMIPNGVEVPDRVSSSRSNDVLRLLYLGRLDPKKGVENLLRACRSLREGGRVKFSLTVAGSGDAAYEESLGALLRGLGLEGHARMVGHVTGQGKRELFEASDVVVVPSYTENFGMVIAEALAHGVPVIASKGTPWQEIESIGCGLYVDNSPQSLATAVEHIATLPLRELGSRGRQWMLREFDWNAIARSTCDLYRCMLANDGPPA